MDQKNLTTQKADAIQSSVLEVVSYDYCNKRNIEVNIKQPEFTSLCPMTGLPDFASIYIQYIPDKHIVELKSLKYYLLQYRNVGIFYEHLVNVILDHLVEKVKPVQMTIIGDFTPRGGIQTTVKATYPESRNS
ncbi:Nitrile oxidoreductase, NADPH-dependent, QueF [Candidatus Magnetomorum sp. HK-1]|nr:Nitrile oxidoreductase, NADPH-dependent, QueF [Candidatus Magnetomorum sp. HK-1]